MKYSLAEKVGISLLIIVIIFASFSVGMRYGAEQVIAKHLTTPPSNINNPSLNQPQNVDFSVFWKAWNLLNEKYVPTKKHPAVSDQAKVYGAIQGLAAAFGDPYTTFFPPVESKDFQTQISGNFEGVGMEVGLKDNIITVIAPLKNTPAYKAGVKTGDKILKIDDKITSNLTLDTAINLIRGKKGTPVKLILLSADAKDPHEVTIVRDVIDIPTLDTEARKDGIFVIRLYNFSENSPSLFRNALQAFINSGDHKLIIDLRGNPGGYLEAAVDMASWFLPSDKVVVTEDAGGHGENIVYKSRGYNIFNKGLKMVIIVDGGSASASEILAGALKEQGVATLVGTKTFGKGSVQELVNVTPDTSLKVTVARWLTPKGNSISDTGLTPDDIITMKTEDVQKGNDLQLTEAVKVLNALQ